MESVALFDRQLWRGALLGGLVSGSLDLAYAFISYAPLGVKPIQILHAIASGWLGKAAYSGGAATAALGLGSHFFIDCVAALIYGVASRRVPLLTTHPVIAGAIFGVAIFVVMNYAIVPLSAAVVGTPRGWRYPAEVLVHIVLIGVPIALLAARR